MKSNWKLLEKGSKGFKGRPGTPEEVSKFMKEFAKSRKRDNKGRFIKNAKGERGVEK